MFPGPATAGCPTRTGRTRRPHKFPLVRSYSDVIRTRLPFSDCSRRRSKADELDRNPERTVQNRSKCIVRSVFGNLWSRFRKRCWKISSYLTRASSDVCLQKHRILQNHKGELKEMFCFLAEPRNTHAIRKQQYDPRPLQLPLRPIAKLSERFPN